MTFVLASALDQHFGGLERTRQTFESLPAEIRAKLDTPEFRKKILSERVFGTFVYPNALAGGLLLLLPLTMAGVREISTKPAIRWLLGGWLTVGGLATLYWSGSKSGWLIALVMAGLALWRLPAKFSLKAMVVGCLVMVGIALFLGRYGSYFEKGASSLSARRDYWRAAGQMIRERPLLGYGPGTFQRQYSALKPPEAEMAKLAHNDYLQQGCDSGLPAMLTYSLFVAAAVLFLYRRSTLTIPRFAAWVGVFGFAVQGLTEFGLYIPGLAWPFFLILGRLMALPPNEIDKPPAPF
jgi:O-antigen ligase